MTYPIKLKELQKGESFSFEENGKIYKIFRKSEYKMLLLDEVEKLLPFHYFIYLKPVFKHG